MDESSSAPEKNCKNCSSADCPGQQQQQGESAADFRDRQKMQSRLCRIKYKIVVLSGKGGVGKSTVAVNLATSLMMAGKRVGLLDVDIHGPSVPTMLNLENTPLRESRFGLEPALVGNMRVMSIGFLLHDQDDAIIWRGPMKMGVIKQFLSDVAWGDLDYLIVDSPPGTGDEPLSVCQLIGNVNGAVIVTTPQRVAAVDVRKSINFCHKLNVPIIGVVENMSGFVCPKCGETTHILKRDGGRIMAQEMGVHFLGSLPLDPQIVEAGDSGTPFVDVFKNSATAIEFSKVTDAVLRKEEKQQ